MYLPSDHTFVVCAYGESPYLEDCIVSLLSQTVKTNIIISTSTPSAYIDEIADRYGLSVFENEAKTGIAGDWNFAVSASMTPLVTIAHQDDIYKPEYAEVMLRHMNRSKSIVLYCCAYGELRDGKEEYSNTLLNIKKTLMFPIWLFPESVFMRRMSLSLGNAICCPSVTYVRKIIADNPFSDGFRANLDWDRWEKLSFIEGDFIFCRTPLMLHRIHSGSETSNVIGETGRGHEDHQMFLRFWPKPIADVLEHFYSKAEKSNSL